jgi:MFS transporter, ACS family, hexuronate transporter
VLPVCPIAGRNTQEAAKPQRSHFPAQTSVFPEPATPTARIFAQNGDCVASGPTDSYTTVVTPTPAQPRTILGLRWWMISLLMLGSIVNYLTRSTLAVAAPTMLKDLSISTQEYSWILNTFQVALMFQPLCGYVMDVIGLKLAFGIFALSWSVISMAHGFAHNWQFLAGLRGLLGLAEGSANPAGMKATSEWFPAKERGFAGGLYNIGASVGSMLAPPLVGFAILYYNWQTAFVLTGALGLIWAVLWFLNYQSPEKHPRLSAAEREYIATGQEQHLRSDGTRPSIFSILRQRNFWGIAIPRFLADPTWGTLTFWLPLYLSQVRHFNLKEIALTAWLPFLAADLGCMFGGVVVAFLQKRGVTLINARRGAFTVGAVLMTGMAGVGFVDSPYAALTLLCLGGFAHQTLSVTVITMSTDLFRKNEVATVAGMAGTCGNAGIFVFNAIIGVLVLTIGYTPFFICLGVLDLVGAVVLWTVVREPARPAAVPVS